MVKDIIDNLLARKMSVVAVLYSTIVIVVSIYRIYNYDDISIIAELVVILISMTVLVLTYANRAAFTPRAILNLNTEFKRYSSVQERKNNIVSFAAKNNIPFKVVRDGIGFISKSDKLIVMLGA